MHEKLAILTFFDGHGRDAQSSHDDGHGCELK